MRYFCLTHKPVEWPIPTFMEQVSTVPVGDGVLNLAEQYPELAGRGTVISEYATLFGIRRMLEDSWTDGAEPPSDEMVGIAHYRRFAVTRPMGTPSFVYGLVRPEIMPTVTDDLFLPAPGTLLLPPPADLGMTVVTQYGAAHHVRDLLHFLGLAIDLGVADDKQVASFLGQNVMIAAPTVGIYPVRWLVETLTALERVIDAFESSAAVPREGYQRRAAGFACERLHSMLTLGLVTTWPDQRIVFNRAMVVSTENRYQDGG
jgi:hypothetical protein